jgi:CO/xanthine dehydrogenase Mo-binding subunit
MLTAQDMPLSKSFVVDVVDPKGPFGAKAAAQMTLTITPPALSNAVYDATGARIKDLPITPEKILKQLSTK